MWKESIVPLPSLCTGCRACEVACGFRQTGVMDPFRSSIEVWRDGAEGKFPVHVHESCDMCPEREIPACIQICGMRALSLGRKGLTSGGRTKG